MVSILISAYTIFVADKSAESDNNQFEARTRVLSDTLNSINSSIQS